MNSRIGCYFLAATVASILGAGAARAQPGPTPAVPPGAGQDSDTGTPAPADSTSDTTDTDGSSASPNDGAVAAGAVPVLPPGVTRAIPGKPPVVPGLPTMPLRPVTIGPPAQRALAQSNAWAENPNAMPTRDNGGRVVFVFNESAPTLVCAPYRVCDIVLQAGEVVQGAPHIGDSVRWKIGPALSGPEDHKTMHLIIKPTEPGLDTNLVVPTDRRTYHLRLVSSFDRYVSSVGFFYPEEDLQSWKDFDKTLSMGSAGMATTGSGGWGDMPTVAVNRLNFDYRIKVVKGKPRFKPLRVMDDGYHTYIAMNEDLPLGEAPALLGISSGGEEQMINYRLKGNLYVVDGITDKLALVSGVGRDQQRVELQRHLCQRRGWLGVCWDPKE